MDDNTKAIMASSMMAKLGSGIGVLAVGIVLFVACSGITARQKTLLPAMQIAWPGVKQDLQRGLPPLTEQIDLLDSGVQSGDPAILVRVEWARLADSGGAGITARVDSGEISIGVAASLRERLRNFGESLTTYLARR